MRPWTWPVTQKKVKYNFVELILALKRTHWVVVGLGHWLVLGGVTLAGNDSLQPPCHGLHQVLQVLVVHDRQQWIGLCKHQNAPECAFRHLQLCSDLSQRDFGLPKLNWSSLVLHRKVGSCCFHSCSESDWSAMEAYSLFPLKQKVFIIMDCPFYTASLTYRRTHRKKLQPAMMTRAAAIIIFSLVKFKDAYCTI